jgi:hypothetical protein
MQSSSHEKLLKLALRLVETIQFSVPLPDEDLELRVELFEALAKPRHYGARLWRIERFRIQSTFPQVEGQPAHRPSDEVILKEFEGFDLPLELQPHADITAFRIHVLATMALWFEEHLGITDL